MTVSESYDVTSLKKDLEALVTAPPAEGAVLASIIRDIYPKDDSSHEAANRVIQFIQSIDAEIYPNGMERILPDGKREPIQMIKVGECWPEKGKALVNLYAVKQKAEAMRLNDPRKFMLMHISEWLNNPIQAKFNSVQPSVSVR